MPLNYGNICRSLINSKINFENYVSIILLSFINLWGIYYVGNDTKYSTIILQNVKHIREGSNKCSFERINYSMYA